jgi:hypothetical protein
MTRLRTFLRSGLLASAFGTTMAQADEPQTVAKLLADGWKIAGYTAWGTTFILFSREGSDHLVQCSVLYDTTRGTTSSERVRTNCYDVR